jgi:magnesium transporter
MDWAIGEYKLGGLHSPECLGSFAHRDSFAMSNAQEKTPTVVQDKAAVDDGFFPRKVRGANGDAGVELHELLRRPTRKGSVAVTCVDYNADRYLVQEIEDLPQFIQKHRPEWSSVRWISVRGLSDMDVIHALAEKYALHPLAIEDVLAGNRRPKVHDYSASGENPGRLFVVAKTIGANGDRLITRQLSFFLGRNTLLSFEDSRQDVFEPVRRRIESPQSHIRSNDVSFLLYVLLDYLGDEFFPILERYAERIERLEYLILTKPDRTTLQSIHRIKRDLLMIHRVAWPTRELIRELTREYHECLSANAATYLRDVHDHMLVVFEIVESYQVFVSTLTESYMSAVSNRTNEIMKTLTMISTIFVPLTFLAGVYGMNMPIPEYQYWFSYPIFWIFSVVLSVIMLRWFKRRGWF